MVLARYLLLTTSGDRAPSREGGCFESPTPQRTEDSDTMVIVRTTAGQRPQSSEVRALMAGGSAVGGLAVFSAVINFLMLTDAERLKRNNRLAHQYKTAS
jgi:hypothetical protein